MREPMTKRQIELARHALGLPNANCQSYRNRFVAKFGHDDYNDWYAMSLLGYAVRYGGTKLPYGGDDMFELTAEGAKSALAGRETLDAEDFTAAFLSHA